MKIQVGLQRIISVFIFCWVSFFGLTQFGIEKKITSGFAAHIMDFCSADLNNDGFNDILSVSSSDHKFAWYENLQDGFFAHQKIIYSGGDFPYLIRVADFNNDNFIDVLGASSVGTFWFENLDGKGFSTKRIISPDSIKVSDVSLSDINHDGFNDVAFVSRENNLIGWFENMNGNFENSSLKVISDKAVGVRTLFIDDLDNDGDSDLISGSELKDGIRCFFNDGSGLFEDQLILLKDRNISTFIRTIDYDNDSDEDILCVLKDKESDLPNSAPIRLYENLGQGTFDFENPKHLGMRLYDEIYNIIDFDGDGDDDIVSGHYWKENLGGGKFQTISLEKAGNIHGYGARPSGNAKLVDIDEDGIKDFVSVSTGVTINWFKNKGLGVLDLPRPVVDGTRHFSSFDNVQVIDVDRDGLLDLSYSSQNENRIGWYRGTDGDFKNVEALVSDIEKANRLKVADLNGDGLLDLITVNSRREAIWFPALENEGFGIRQDLIVGDEEFHGGGSFSFDILQGDIDSDGDLDIIFPSSKSYQEISWIENNGQGEFKEVHSMGGRRVNDMRHLKVADFNGDGNVDLVYTYETKFYLDLNDGFGNFSQEVELDLASLLSRSSGLSIKDVFATDFNADGKMDIIISYFGKNGKYQIQWFRNNSNKLDNMKLITEVELPDSETSLITRDINLDGYPDFLLGNMRFDKVLFFENDQNGGVGNQRIVAENLRGSGLNLVADFDDDGDLDLVFSSEGRLDQNVRIWNLYYSENFVANQAQIQGQVFFDENQNGILDHNEHGMSSIKIISNPKGDFAFTDEKGNYSLYFAGLNGAFELKPEISEKWSVVSDSDHYEILLDTSTLNYSNLDFGLFPDTVFTNVTLDLESTRHRCDENAIYWINIKNVGTKLAEGYVCLELDENVSFRQSSVPVDSIIDGKIYWNFDSLWLAENFRASVTVQSPDFRHIGEKINVKARVIVVENASQVFEVKDSLQRLLTCAYDPNDKIGRPEGLDSLGYIDSNIREIEYTIRFQNTGNDTAKTVVITDKLDVNLDWESIAPVSASHDFRTDVDASGKVIFTFRDINLPDSSTNQGESNGFIKFSILLNSKIAPRTSIYNSANIFFDSNPAVITNTEIHTVFDCKSIFKSMRVSKPNCLGNSLKVSYLVSPSNTQYTWELDGYPVVTNPEAEFLVDRVDSINLRASIQTPLCYYDTIIPITFNSVDSIHLDTVYICHGTTTRIFDKDESLEGIYSKRYFSQNTGCDSVHFQYLKVNDIIRGDTVMIKGCYNDSVLIGDGYIKKSGVFSDTLSTSFGCDSIVYTQVTFDPEVKMGALGKEFICLGDSIIIFNRYESEPSIYFDTTTSVYGCDSILRRELSIYDIPVISFSDIGEINLCKTKEDIELKAEPAGGNFYGASVFNNMFYPNLGEIGDNKLYYELTYGNNCSIVDSLCIRIEGCNNADGIRIFPNPFENFTNLTVDAELFSDHTLFLHNSLGQEVLSQSIEGSNAIMLYADSFGKGVFVLYILDNSSGSVVYMTKLISN